MCAVIAHTPRPYLRVTAGRKTAFLLTFSNTKKMINLFDSIAFIDAEVETDDPDGEEYQAKASKAAADAFNGLFNA